MILGQSFYGPWACEILYGNPISFAGSTASEPLPEAVNHPKHYNSHPAGVEAITICEHMNFNTGNAMKYIWRAGLKSPDPIEDLKKAKWYVEREIGRLTKATTPTTPSDSKKE